MNCEKEKYMLGTESPDYNVAFYNLWSVYSVIPRSVPYCGDTGLNEPNYVLWNIFNSTDVETNYLLQSYSIS